MIDTLLRNDLIILDEVGFAPLDDTGTQLLFRFIAAYERRALGVGSHWSFEQWGRFLPEHTTSWTNDGASTGVKPIATPLGAGAPNASRAVSSTIGESACECAMWAPAVGMPPGTSRATCAPSLFDNARLRPDTE